MYHLFIYIANHEFEICNRRMRSQLLNIFIYMYKYTYTYPSILVQKISKLKPIEE